MRGEAWARRLRPHTGPPPPPPPLPRSAPPPPHGHPYPAAALRYQPRRRPRTSPRKSLPPLPPTRASPGGSRRQPPPCPTAPASAPVPVRHRRRSRRTKTHQKCWRPQRAMARARRAEAVRRSAGARGLTRRPTTQARAGFRAGSESSRRLERAPRGAWRRSPPPTTPTLTRRRGLDRCCRRPRCRTRECVARARPPQSPERAQRGQQRRRRAQRRAL
mmetsp:Transcript_13600/g.32823  ORF Transcript_13600/g.32823 Transcript_13600/m.32823 type:complete len:218 (-) Transcript_13600:835-1488(-)